MWVSLVSGPIQTLREVHRKLWCELRGSEASSELYIDILNIFYTRTHTLCFSWRGPPKWCVSFRLPKPGSIQDPLDPSRTFWIHGVRHAHLLQRLFASNVGLIQGDSSLWDLTWACSVPELLITCNSLSLPLVVSPVRTSRSRSFISRSCWRLAGLLTGTVLTGQPVLPPPSALPRACWPCPSPGQVLVITCGTVGMVATLQNH